MFRRAAGGSTVSEEQPQRAMTFFRAEDAPTLEDDGMMTMGPMESHSADCLYYVVSGEAHMGSRVLKPGDGFFILAEAPYAYTAGPEGVEVLEFRHATTFDIKIRDKTLEHWKPVIEAIKAHGESWAPAPVGAG